MKAAVLVEKGRIEVQDIPRPTPEPDEVLCRVEYVGICGTDLHAYQALVFPAGTVLGHESSAEIVDVGAEVSPDRVGEHIVIRPSYVCGVCEYCLRGEINRCVQHFGQSIGTGVQGAFAEFVCVKDYMAIRLPEGMSDRSAALVEPLACCVHAVRRSELRLGDKVAIFGAGPIGLLMIACARASGASSVYVCERSATRSELALRMGADYLFAVDESANGSTLVDLSAGEVDIAFECAGHPTTVNACFEVVKKGGQVIMEGLSEEPVPIDHFRWVEKEIDAKASIGSNQAEFLFAIELIHRGIIDVEPLISRVIELAKIDSDGFRALSDSDGAGKILVGVGSH